MDGRVESRWDALPSFGWQVFPPCSLKPDRRRIGGQRVALTGTFPTALLRTARDRFRVKQLAGGYAPTYGRARGGQFQSGFWHHAYRVVTDPVPPVVLRPANGSPVPPGGT